MDLKQIKNLSSIVLLMLITTATTAYSTNNTINDTKIITNTIKNTNKTTTSPFTKIVQKHSDNVLDINKRSTPYIQVLNLNEAGGAIFSSGSTKISKKGLTNLNLFVKQVITSGITPSSITIVGYTDNVGTEKANKHLSERRAITVANHLASKGLDSTLMHVTGLGETRPVATNESQVGRAQNNRVFIRVYGERKP